MSKFKVLYYVNQFFGQIGGEDKAGMKPEYKKGAIGPAMGLKGLLGDEGEIIGTMICGDNYFNEHEEDALGYIMKIIKEENPDIVVAGPAFNAGRYGMACAGVVNAVVKQLGKKAVTGMYIENPAVDLAKPNSIIIETKDSAAGMKEALPKMASVIKKIMNGEELGTPLEEGYIPQGRRVTVFSDDRGSKRAVDMLLKRLNNEEFETELPMPVFDRVDPADAIADLSKATIALVTTGGIVPKGNPDRIQSASAQKWGKYDVSKRDDLKDGYETIHGGYDPVYANEDPDRIAPLDILKEFEKEGKIAKVYDYFYTTTGTGTAVGKSVEFGTEIGQELSDAGVDGVIMTST